MSSTAIPKVVPAQLSFLAIYNPDLGTSDDTFHRQIVFYHSKAAQARSKLHGTDTQAEKELREQENEKLRQVGLAQGMLGFARSFSSGAAVDSVETQKSRIVLHELEKGWWILASVDLTQLPAHPASSSSTNTSNPELSAVDYSSREVSPPSLLIQQLIRAHNIFTLHHGTTLNEMFTKHERAKFCGLLDTYWSRFANTWDVLLHGSPAVDVYNGLKLAAGGELGMGVGEEEWGSGERLVLEDFVQKTEGLVDLMVSRFGEPSPLQDRSKSSKTQDSASAPDSETWFGSGRSSSAADGVVFSGVGSIARHSLRDLSQWVETIYLYGDHAYGVRDNPLTNRKKRRRRNPVSSALVDGSAEVIKQKQPTDLKSPTIEEAPTPPGIPPPLVKAVEKSLNKASNAVDSGSTDTTERPVASLGDTETWMKYLTLGYGSSWGGTSKKPSQDQPAAAQASQIETSSEVPMQSVEPEPDIDHAAEKLKMRIQQENSGYFVIGLKGDMGEDEFDDVNDDGEWNNRTLLRTVHVELSDEGLAQIQGAGDEDTPQFEKELKESFKYANPSRLTRIRPVVYVHRPFIYTFLFRHRTESLTLATFYRDLHTYFSPLHRPLSNSTSPDKIAARICSSTAYTISSSNKGIETDKQPIYDLVYDPRTLTVHSSIPNIPDPGTLIAEGLGSNTVTAGWSRLEALNVHSQILTMVTNTRRSRSEIEQTCKTSRSWWVVWMRLPPSQTKESDAEDGEYFTDELREAFLIRRARDASASAKNSGSRLGGGIWKPSGEKMGGAAAGWGPKGLAEGIGIDARKYVEGLLSLNR